MRSTLRVQLFGEFRLVYGDELVASLDSPRRQALLAYLVLHRNAPQARQHLAFLFWPDSTESQALTNLRRELHHLRQELPEADRFLRAGIKSLHWRPDESASVDVADFEAALATAEHAAAVGNRVLLRDSLEQALALYQGDLLPACYDDWILPERERLREHFLWALASLADLLEEQHDYPAAIRHAERLLRHDPLREATYRRLMHLHVLNRDRAQALRVYHTCATILERELGVEPSAATRAAHEQLLNMAPAPPSEGRATAAASTALVGRRAEWARLHAAGQAAAQGGARFVALAGEAGIGKTRLAEELLAWGAQHGLRTARTRSYAAEGRLAYAPVAEWLRAEAIRPHLDRLEKVWLTEVARLLPELLVESPNLPRPEPLTQSWQRQRLFEALARAVLAGREPLVLLFDDLQWSDQETLEWLRYLLRFDPEAALLVVGTIRAEEVEGDHPLVALLLDLGQAGQVTEIALGPLDAADTAALAALVAGDGLDPEEAARLYRETEGNPLFVVETVRAELGQERAGRGEDREALPAAPQVPPPEAALPPRVHAVIQARLGQLSPPARELAGLAAAIGRAFTFELLAAAGGGDEEALARGLDELWQRRIVREQGSDAYDFSHDKLREVAYGGLSPARRRLLHRRIARALEQVNAAGLDAVSGQLADHYERAGLADQAIPYYQRAAEVAQRVFANGEAIGFLRQGLAALERLPAGRERDERELGLQSAVGVALVATRGYGAPEVRAVYRRVLELCEGLGKPLSAPILRALALVSVGQGLIADAYEWSSRLLHRSQEENDAVLRVEAHYVVGVTLFWMGDFVAARRHLEEAIVHYDPQRHRVHTTLYAQDPKVICLVRLALDLWYLGYPDQALQRCREGLALAEALAHPLSRAYALTYAAWLSSELSDLHGARRQAEVAIALADEQQLGFWPPTTTFLEGWALVGEGEATTGIARIREGIAAQQLTGQTLHLPYALTLLAEALLRAGEIEAGRRVLDEAFALIERTWERFIEAELCRLEGEFLLAEGYAGSEVEAAFRRAQAVAQRQGARSLELRAAMALSRLWRDQGRRAEAHQVLAEVYASFTEGFGTRDLQAARALLDELVRDL